jgi:RHS repeat-associated protein
MLTAFVDFSRLIVLVFRARRLWSLLWFMAACFSWVQVQAQPVVVERVVSFEYDDDGLMIKEVIEPDRPDDCLQATHTHDAYGNRISTSKGACLGAAGHTLSSATAVRTEATAFLQQAVSIGGSVYNSPAGAFATSSTNALGQVEFREFDPRHGSVTKLVGPNGGVTSWEYDGFGRRVRESRADGSYTLWTYRSCWSPAGNDSICHGYARWYVSQAVHDASGALTGPITYQLHGPRNEVVRVRTLDFHGEVVVQDTRYNKLGQVTQKSIPYRMSGGIPHWTTFAYDVLGRVTSESSPDGNGGIATTQMAYDRLVSTVTNPQGQTKKVHKNAAGQTTKVIDHLGHEVRYTYDPVGQLIKTDAPGSTVSISYNRRGQKQSMQDPALGAWDYAYNAFGELVWQQDSLSQISTMAFDALGRMTQRTEPDLVSHWHYDKKADGSACGAGIGKLCEATANNGYRRVHAYDAIGRPTSTATALDSPTNLATVSQTFHPQTGRLASKTWPTGYQAMYSYSASGFLAKVEGGGVAGHMQVVSLEILAMDPQGRITQYKHGNNVTTVKAFDEPTGKLNSVQATLQGQKAGNVHNHSYGYDKLGNLLTRNDVNTGVAESFQYDSLNRLSLYTALGGGLSSAQAVQTLYDAAGNLKYKSDVGYYHYDPLRPSRLNQVTLAPESGWSAIGAVTQANTGTRALSYAFDDMRVGAKSITTANGSQAMGNGNLWYTVSQDQVNGRHTVRWETYTSFNMPKEIMLGDLSDPGNPTAAVAERTLSFAYGPEHQRIRQTVALTSNVPSHMEAGTTWYLNGTDSQGLSYEKEIKANGTIEHKHYVNAGGMSFALYVKREGNLNGKPSTSISYFHHDHLGSIAVISNELGVVTERLAYDPWGRRRNTDGQTDIHDALYGVNTDRGYTMHEHLDEMGIVHMNGRIYDPLIGRFMSADPYIQAPGNLQSYNRYSYVLNNPLAYTDPSGYFSFKKLFKVVAVIAIGVVTAGAAAAAMATQLGYASIAAATIGPTATWGSAMAVGAAAGAAGSAASTFAQTGNLKQSLKAGVRGGVTGAAFAGLSQGISQHNWMDGGHLRFDHMANPIPTTMQRVATVAGQTVISGAVSHLAGGDFAVGAGNAFPFLAFAEASSYMRTEMTMNSMRNPDNFSGNSAGVLGDNAKIGGERVDSVTGIAGSGPMGGQQGGEGQMWPFGSYKPHSAQDVLVEHYAGPHDFLNSWTYDANGNFAAHGNPWAAVGNYFNVLSATPFVASHAIRNYMPAFLTKPR